VINSGGTVAKYIARIRTQDEIVPILVVSIVMQEHAFRHRGLGAHALDDNLEFVSLSLSANSYVGKGKTDTGNRLFNTTSKM
jgi:hypothetical protein